MEEDLALSPVKWPSPGGDTVPELTTRAGSMTLAPSWSGSSLVKQVSLGPGGVLTRQLSRQASNMHRDELGDGIPFGDQSKMMHPRMPSAALRARQLSISSRRCAPVLRFLCVILIHRGPLHSTTNQVRSYTLKRMPWSLILSSPGR